jgi:asparagine synthase (glutamine-hydrolysing)
MCGITAIFDATDGNLRPLVETMTSSLRHRGPDDADTWQGEGGTVALGHRRLSIIDLSPLGRNPMPYRDRYWITFNGEIYNFRPLRNELEHAGYRFRSQTDTEVILAAYDHWGAECLRRFVGMFALALWDEARGELFLARDRVGKKPLYYAEYGGRIAVASELKAIVADSRFPRIVDPRAVAQYLRYGYVPAPLSIYAHARKLTPGHYALVRGGRVETYRYWDPVPFATDAAAAGDVETAERRLEELLRDAIGLRMLADVPVGAFLSGGIDSSLIVALMQEQSASKVKTFTIRFDDPAFNEADHAAAVARHLKTDHYEQTCDARQMLEVVDLLPDAFDEPFADSSAIPTYLVSKIARQRVTVALSGDGGDELFFGYPRYWHHMNTGWVLTTPHSIRRAAAAVIGAVPRRTFRRAAHVLRSEDDDRYERFISWWSPDEARRLTGNDAERSVAYADVQRRSHSLDENLRPGLLDLVTYLPDDILAKVDRASMQVSLETRCPLLDHRVVEFALGLPLDLKWRSGTTKWLLRRLLHRRVPAALVERPKMGFGVPLSSWLRGPLRDRADRLFGSSDLETVGIDADVAREEWRRFASGRSDASPQIWNLFAIAAWAARWQPQPSASVAT